MKAKSYVVVGMQWGDEGKGKLIDVLSHKVDYVVRYQGGNNAGHTVVVGEEKFVLHLLPSGIIGGTGTCVIGAGVVVDLEVLWQEMEDLKKRGNPVRSLLIDPRAHIIMPYHIALDRSYEAYRGDAKIGTTGRGVGPCYEDKIGRKGVQMVDFLNLDSLAQKIRQNLEEKNVLLKHYGGAVLDAQEVFGHVSKLAHHFIPMIKDTVVLLNQSLDQGLSVLFEGAQATMLDVTLGTYPYVTGSSPTSGGVCTGTGVPPQKIGKVFGVTKAYTTRVGEGPFPTELTGKLGEDIRTRGSEFGATTGRPRKCGWFDLVVARYAVLVNGLTDVVLTKLDILSHIPTLQVAVKYTIQGRHYEVFPAHLTKDDKVEVTYEYLEGWDEDISSIKNYEDLPLNCRKYIEFLEKQMRCPISMVSIGPERSQNIFRGASMVD